MHIQGPVPKYPTEHLQVVRYRNGYTLFVTADGQCLDKDRYFFVARAEADAAKALIDRELQIYRELGVLVRAFKAGLLAAGYPEEAVNMAFEF